MQVTNQTVGGSLAGFIWRGRSYRIAETLECWLMGHEVGYRVVSGQQVFDLRGDPASTAWTLDVMSD
jgi:hypothetical protein